MLIRIFCSTQYYFVGGRIFTFFLGRHFLAIIPIRNIIILMIIAYDGKQSDTKFVLKFEFKWLLKYLTIRDGQVVVNLTFVCDSNILVIVFRQKKAGLQPLLSEILLTWYSEISQEKVMGYKKVA